MVLLILSDLHGNISALYSVLSEIKKYNIEQMVEDYINAINKFEDEK